MPDSKSIEALRLKRTRISELQAQKRLRNEYGQRFVSAIASAVGKPISLADFDESWQSQLELHWPREISAAPGLVAAHVARDDANRLLRCFQTALAAICGRIGYHGKSYLGYARLEDVDPTALLTASELAEDSVLFYVENPAGIILVDCYASQPSEPFSIVVQGNDLIGRLRPCFSMLSQTRQTGSEIIP